MSKNRDKVVESLPENLLYNSDSEEICSNQILSSNTTWGPFDVDKSPVDLNSTNLQIWSNIMCVEWVNFLIENSIQKSPFNTPDEDYNVKIMFSKKELQILLTTTKDLEFNSEFKCSLVIVDHLPTKLAHASDLPAENDQNNDKMTKSCKFCGINFSHQCTLEAHMTYYCSRRQNNITEISNTPKFQKTWRTRQRNKQSNYSKINNDNTSINSKLFGDEVSKLKNVDRSICSKIIVNAAFNNSETNQLDNQLNLNSNPIILNSSTSKKSILQPGILPNGNTCSSNNSNVKTNESEKIRNNTANNSDSEPENGISANLCFCAPCGLFFSSKDLYNIHLQLDSSSLQLSAAKCNSLVLAAPLINNNGIQYVPIHPRTTVLNPLNNNSIKIQQNYKPNNFEDPSSVTPLDLSVNTSKSPITLSNDRVQIDVANRIAAAAATLGIPNCNQLLRSNKRPFLCPHCQTRFQLYSTFQAHQEFYCQGKRQQTDVTIPEKRSRTTSNNSGLVDFDLNVQKTDDGNWNVCNQGFKCNSCGFIGQTKRGIRIHCKNQCFKNKTKNHKSDNKSEDIEVCSPAGDQNNIINNRSPDNTDFYNEDSPVKIEPV